MTDEERAAAREQRREEMEARREAARERFEGMSEEERQEMRELMQQRGRGGFHRGRRGGGADETL